MLNKVILIGNLGVDPEIKEFENGSVANFRIATNETYKNKNGERVTQTEWHNIRVGIPGLVELVKKYFKKGDPIYVEGKIRTRTYEKDGQPRYVTEINVDTIKFLPKGREHDGNSHESGSQENYPKIEQSASDADFITASNTGEDDLPF